MNEVAWFFLTATAVKLLLAPSYHSTDFEVHRHWIALTSSLPVSEWYTHSSSSPWTLDYPPLFAFFQLLLSLPIPFLHVAVDPAILHLTLPHPPAPSVILFMRSTVALSDLALLLAAGLLTRRLGPTQRSLVLAAVVWSPALLIVDHVHFQYNGVLLGILLLSLGFLADGRDLVGGFVFAVLICSKHLFMVAAPVYFVYLLRHYCFPSGGGFRKGVGRLLKMGAAVAVAFAGAFAPFVYYGQVYSIFDSFISLKLMNS